MPGAVDDRQTVVLKTSAQFIDSPLDGAQFAEDLHHRQLCLKIDKCWTEFRRQGKIAQAEVIADASVSSGQLRQHFSILVKSE